MKPRHLEEEVEAVEPATVPSECGDQYALAINPEGGEG